MNREQIFNILAEAGIDTASCKAAVTNILNAHNEEMRNAKVEAEKKALEDFKDWKSPEEWEASQAEFKAYKDEQAKVGRVAKFKEKKILEKYHHLAETELKDKENFDEALESWVKEHQELCEIEKKPAPKPAPRFTKMNDSGTDTAEKGANSEFNKGFREALGIEA